MAGALALPQIPAILPDLPHTIAPYQDSQLETYRALSHNAQGLPYGTIVVEAGMNG